ncbi:MAG: GDSL-type esterase/lipase family protein [Acidobacteriota bacterium]
MSEVKEGPGAPAGDADAPLSARAKALLSTLSLLLFAAFDLGLRLFHVNAAYRARTPTPFAREDPIVGYRLRSNLDVTETPSAPLRLDRVLQIAPLPAFRVRTNALGLRHDGEISLPAPPGAYRILALGDSYTFGYGVDLDAAYPTVVGREIARRMPDRKVEAVDAAQPGHSSVQGRLFYERILDGVQADLVTVSYGANDYGVGIVGYPSAQKKLDVVTGVFQKARCLFLHTETFVLFLRARDALDRKIKKKVLPKLPGPGEVRGRPEDCRAALAAIVAAAKARGARQVIVVTQARAPGDVNEPFYREAAVQAAAESGAEIADAAAAMERAMEALPTPEGGWGLTPNRFFVDPTHLTAEGHRVAAEAVLAVAR